MYEDSSYQPYQSQEETSQKHSGYGIASFVIALISGLLTIGFCVFAIWIGDQSTSFTGSLGIGELAVFGLCGTSMLLNLVGVGLGIVGVVQKDVNKVFGILGLVFNGLILLAYAGFVILGLVLGLAFMGSGFY